MDIVKVLKRRDGSSIVVAIVVGLLVSNAVQAWAYRPSAWLSSETTEGGGWNAGLWRPLVTLVVSIIVLELAIRLYVWLNENSGKTTRKSR